MKEVERLRNGRDRLDVVDLTNRVFDIKLRNLLDDIMKKQIFGKVVGHVWVIGKSIKLSVTTKK